MYEAFTGNRAAAGRQGKPEAGPSEDDDRATEPAEEAFLLQQEALTGGGVGMKQKQTRTRTRTRAKKKTTTQTKTGTKKRTRSGKY